MLLLIAVLMLPHQSILADPSIKYNIIPDELPWYRYNDSDYYIDTRILVTYTEAVLACESLGGSLPILDSVEKRSYVLSLIPTLTRPPYSFHIGLKIGSIGGKLTQRWYSGTESSYNIDEFANKTEPLKLSVAWWAPSQPRTASHGVAIMGTYWSYEPTFQWRIVFSPSFESITMLMCQREAYNLMNLDPPPPLELNKPDDLDVQLFLRPYSLFEVTWVPFAKENVNIHISYTRPVATRDLGETYCSDLGAHLVLVKTNAKQKFLVQQFRKKNTTLWRDHAFYIGLERSRDITSLNNWMWSDDDVMKEAYWYPSEPKVVRNLFDVAAKEYAYVQMGGHTVGRNNEDFLWLNVIGRTKPFEIKTYPACERRRGGSHSVPPPDYNAINAGKRYNWTGKYHVYIDDPDAPAPNITPTISKATTTTQTTSATATTEVPGVSQVGFTTDDVKISIVDSTDDVPTVKDPLVRLLEAIPLKASSQGVVTGVVLGGLALILIGLTAGYFVILSMTKSSSLSFQSKIANKMCTEVSGSSTEQAEMEVSSTEDIEAEESLVELIELQENLTQLHQK